VSNAICLRSTFPTIHEITSLPPGFGFDSAGDTGRSAALAE